VRHEPPQGHETAPHHRSRGYCGPRGWRTCRAFGARDRLGGRWRRRLRRRCRGSLLLLRRCRSDPRRRVERRPIKHLETVGRGRVIVVVGGYRDAVLVRDRRIDRLPTIGESPDSHDERARGRRIDGAHGHPIRQDGLELDRIRATRQRSIRRELDAMVRQLVRREGHRRPGQAQGGHANRDRGRVRTHLVAPSTRNVEGSVDFSRDGGRLRPFVTMGPVNASRGGPWCRASTERSPA